VFVIAAVAGSLGVRRKGQVLGPNELAVVHSLVYAQNRNEILFVDYQCIRKLVKYFDEWYSVHTLWGEYNYHNRLHILE